MEGDGVKLCHKPIDEFNSSLFALEVEMAANYTFSFCFHSNNPRPLNQFSIFFFFNHLNFQFSICCCCIEYLVPFLFNFVFIFCMYLCNFMAILWSCQIILKNFFYLNIIKKTMCMIVEGT